ncbi:MFS transporter [Lapillicoccus sp.]|uniref:MFS transporter n=1 Tax=Lapillicoccus sp. TaxID=1909287 RepID=UPI0025F01036|nr:MFS transporter [Lapillicoccus sp.]
MRTLSPRAAFAAIVAAFAVTMIGTTLPTPMYGIYQQRFGFSLSMSTVIFAVYAAGVLVALLVTGRWSDAVGRRPLLLGGLGLALLSDLVFLAATDTWVLLIGRVLSGFSAGVYVGTATAAVIESATPAWKDRAPLVATVANVGGLGLGPMLAAVLVDLLPWPTQLSFVVHIVLVLAATALVWRAPETVEVEPGARLQLRRPSVPGPVRSTFVAASIVGFAGFAVMGLMTAVSPRLVERAVPGAGQVLSVLVVFVLFVASVGSQVVLNRMQLARAVNLGCGLLVLGMLLLAVAIGTDSLALMLVAAVASGAGQGLSFSKGLASVLTRTEPDDRAGLTSAFFVVAYVAISLPVVGDGLASQKWGLGPAGVWFSVAVAGLAVAALVALVVDQRRVEYA